MKAVQFQMAINKVEVRSEDGSIIIEGLASTPQIDRYNSIITVDSIRNGMTNYLTNAVILLGHDSSKAIGLMIDHRIDNEGLRIKAKLVRDTDNVFQDIKDGLTKGFSVGFYPLEWVYENKSGIPLSSMSQDQIDELDYNDVVRKITKIDLIEISVVNTPANPSALFSLSRALKNFFDDYEKRSVLGLQQRVIVSEQDNPFNPDQPKIEEPKEEEIQGDEVETTGETPEAPQEKDTDPTTVEEAPQETEPEKAEGEDTTAAVAEETTQTEDTTQLQAMLDDCFEVMEKQDAKIKALEVLIAKTPSKRAFVTMGGTQKADPLIADMRSAKEKAGVSI